MKVFLTGGTGFVGREVLWRLHEEGHSIRMLARSAKDEQVRQMAYRHSAELIPGDLLDRGALVEGMQGCGAVIHLVGIINESGKSSFQRIHVEGTEHVLGAAQEAGVGRFVHMSALGTREGARSRYHQTKWQGEVAVRSSGLRWTIFRPSVIYGRGDGFVNLLAQLCKWSPVIPLFGGGNNRLQPVSVEDVARCFVSALSAEAVENQVIDLCGFEVFTLREIYRVILRTTRRWRPMVAIPMPLARIQAAAMESLFGLAGRPSPLTRDQLLMLEEDNCGDAMTAAKLFGIKPATFEEGIARYLR
ncbi:MAG TPA: hypothetical protein DCY13_17610 [Verrucomicrobiales bacterium]|nr:hypothetical protein [Verrucomicrobiales bacterium]